MFPILYEQITAGTVPQHHGLGVLSDCISCEVEQERNGIYELVMVYPVSGIHAQEIAQRRVLKVKPNFTDLPQLFRIDRIGKTMSGTFTVYAKHISYDLSGYAITWGSASTAVGACQLLTNATKTHGAGNDPDFVIQTDKQVTADFTIKEPASVKSFFAGKEGSFLDVFGTAEIKYNNFNVDFLLHAGVVEPRTTIRYGKNLLELSQEMDCSKLYTDVLCYFKPYEGDIVTGNKVSTGLSLDVPKTLILDVSSDFEEIPTIQQLDDFALGYINTHNLTVPTNNITLDFVQSGQLSNRVDLCDNVDVYYEALGITRARVKCIRTKWDCLQEKYIETEFGDVKQSLADTIAENTAEATAAKSTADSAASAVAGKKRVFVNEPLPPYDVGDLWTVGGSIYVCQHSRAAGYITSIGTTTTPIEDGSETNPIIINGESYTAQFGDLVTYIVIGEEGEQIPTQFVWDSEKWREYDDYLRATDWVLATDYVDESDLSDTIAQATSIITGNTGGNIVINFKTVTVNGQETKWPYEMLILCDADNIDDATQLWRFNAGGLGYSSNGYDGPYETAITINPETGKGIINANLIAGQELNAQQAGIQELTAAMFAGNKIVLGGTDSSSLEVQDLSSPPKTTIRIDANGMECFGAAVGGVTPSVVFDKNGVTGYSNSADKENTAIFWTKSDNFYMKNGVVENEFSIGGKIKFVPITTTTNDGIAIVAAL